jgi:Mlc titration factor MtfA (ptsG expression regulator)
VVRAWLRERRRTRIRQRPFPEEWDAILERNVPIYQRLSEVDRSELKGHIRIFLAEKRFEGAGGLTITDEIRVTIAAQACVLLLHRTTNYYPGLYTIIVYPGAYVAAHTVREPMGIVTERTDTRLGESSSRGAVVLSWDAVEAAASDVGDCRNVVLHEFAHQLDAENGSVAGAPALPDRSRYVAWARILGRDYERLRHDAALGRQTVLDRYGATNPAEFFAVTTECFFTRPKLLKARHPELYAELRQYYQQDPVEEQ